MSKPLTIEELKALKVGDWVWVCGTEYGNQYAHICRQNFEEKYINLTLTFGSNKRFKYADYGKTWLAYKNKEAAETKGEIVELPCLRDKPPIGCKDSPIRVKELNYMTDDGTICSQLYLEDEFAEAERRLAELKGENNQ